MVEAHFEHWDRLLFRDYLIQHPEVAREYAELKMRLSELHDRDRVAYTKAKSDDLAKVAVNRLAFSQDHELAPYQATAVAITPGWLRSEMMLDNYGVTESDWRSAAAPPGIAVSESPRYVGRAVAALAADPGSAQLAAEYGFTDVDGSRPDVWRYTWAVEDGAQDVDPSDFR